MVTILPNQGAELGKNLAMITEAIGQVIQPERQYFDAMKKIAITNPKLFQELADAAHTNPDSFKAMGLERLVPIITATAESPESQFNRENRAEIIGGKKAELKAKTAQAEIVPQLLEVERLQLQNKRQKLTDLVAQHPNLANVDFHEIAYKFSKGEKLDSNITTLLEEPSARAAFTAALGIRESNIQYERQKALVDLRDKSENSLERRAQIMFERTEAGTPKAWQQYFQITGNRDEIVGEIQKKSVKTDDERALVEVYNAHKSMSARERANEAALLGQRLSTQYTKINRMLHPKDDDVKVDDATITANVNDLNAILAERSASSGRFVRASVEEVSGRMGIGKKKELVFRTSAGVIPEAEALATEAPSQTGQYVAMAMDLAQGIIAMKPGPKETQEAFNRRYAAELKELEASDAPQEVKDMVKEQLRKARK